MSVTGLHFVAALIHVGRLRFCDGHTLRNPCVGSRDPFTSLK
jgi:hypothetical protein